MRTNMLLGLTMLGVVLACGGCDQSSGTDKEHTENKSFLSHSTTATLPHLNIQEVKAKYALPFCEKKDCLTVDIQTVQTSDSWLDGWIEKNMSDVVRLQIDEKQAMTLQQAIDAFVKKSDAWQQADSRHAAYALSIKTRVATQRNQYLLLQLTANSKIAALRIKERNYFFVADRQQQKTLKLLDILQPAQQQVMNDLVQARYQGWLKKQAKDVQQTAPKKLYWGQADWFFDQEGIGLHYRSGEISEEAAQLDIYFSKEETRQLLKADVFAKMF